PAELVVFEPEEVEPLVTAEVGGSALFASRFRECAARALLLPKRRPGTRTPLWQQRQRAAQLLSVAADYGSFPVVLETMRECLQDVFDVPGLTELMRDVAARRVRLVEVETPMPSPFAQSLLFAYVGAFMYEGDSPLAERRAQALSLDPRLLAELLGQAELRELLDATALAEVEAELQRLAPDRRARDGEDAADMLRLLGGLATGEAVERGVEPAWLVELEASRRVIRVRIAGQERWIAIEDAGRVRDALGVPLPVGVPEAFTEPVRDPLGDLLSRYARTHGPFTVAECAARFGLGPAVVADALGRLAAAGRVVSGEFRPGGQGVEWCDAEVLRMLRRRTLAKLRREVEPVPAATLGEFLPAWQHVGGGRGHDAVLRAVEQLQGAAVPASALERLLLPARVADYAPTLLDELCASGEVVWAGQGALPGNDGWIALALADQAPALLPPPDPDAALTDLHRAVLEALGDGHALFFRRMSDRMAATDDQALAAAVWDLVWSGYLTNDTLAPLRTLLGAGRTAHTGRRPPPRPRYGRTGRPVMPSRTGPPTVAGRWSLLPDRETDPTVRSYALAETLLDRYGVVTRDAVAADRVPGGFAAVYPVLKAMEESGRVRRGYFVETLGGAQFALPGAVERLRAVASVRERRGQLTPPGMPVRRDERAALVLAATDPANPYGGALPWPERPDGGGHKPGRKAGALVVLVHGELALYVERGGKTLLSFTDDPSQLQPAVDALALAVRDGWLGKLTVERADGERVSATPLAQALQSAGFHPTPRGLRLRT
ncbi:MAG: DEAD/DEAH box helicase, partial [Mycobacteriales bacterium]